MNCRQLADAIASGRHRHLGVWGRFQLWWHRRMCPPCQDYVDQLQALGETLRESCAEGEPCDGECERIEAEILERCYGEGCAED